MAKRAEAPSRSQLLEELDDIDDEAVEGAESGEDTGEATPPEGSDPSTEGEEPAEEQEELEGEEPEGAPAQASVPAAWQPPEGGQPFRFRADHREVEVPGALEYDHGIYVPRDAWNGVVSRHLADREQFQQREFALQRQVEALNPEIHPEVIQSRVAFQKLLELFDKGPEEVAKWLDNFAQNRPLLEANIQLATKDAQLQARTQQMSEAEYEAALSTAAQNLPGWITQNIGALITQVPELAVLKGQEQRLMQELWPFAKSFLWEADRDYPEYGVQKGQVVPLREPLEAALRQEATRRQELLRLQKASKHNRAATGKAPSPKTVATRGRPVPAGPAKRYKPGESRQAKDDFMAWDPMADEE